MSKYEEIINQARLYGFHFHNDYIRELQSKENITDGQQYIKSLIDLDIRKQPFVLPYFVNDNSNNQTEYSGVTILQLVSVTNVCQPSKRQGKMDENSHDIYRMVFTDGHTKVSGITLQPFQGISTDLSPGLKFQYFGGKVINGFLIVSTTNLKIVGGRVVYLHEAFVANQTAQRLRLVKGLNDKHQKTSSDPPIFEKLSSVVDNNDNNGLIIKQNRTDLVSNKTQENKLDSIDSSLKQAQDSHDIKNSGMNNIRFSENRKPKVGHVSSPSNKETVNLNRGMIVASEERGDKSSRENTGRGKGRYRREGEFLKDHSDKNINEVTSRTQKMSIQERGSKPSERGRGRGANRGGRHRGDRSERTYFENNHEPEQNSRPILEMDFPELSTETPKQRNKSWKCKTCTFENHSQLECCEMCQVLKT